MREVQDASKYNVYSSLHKTRERIDKTLDLLSPFEPKPFGRS